VNRAPKPNSLRRLLLLRLIAPLAVLLLAGAYAAYRYAVHYADYALDTNLYDSARALANQVQMSKGGFFLDLPKQAIEMFETDTMDQHYYAVTVANRGRVFGNAVLPALTVTLTADMQPISYDAEIEGNPVHIVAMAMLSGEANGNERVVIRVAETLVRRNALAREMLLTMILPQGLLLIAALAAIAYGVNAGLRPLAEVAGQIGTRNVGDLSPLRTDVPVEVAPLTEALNRLFAGLDEAQLAQQRFIADAAHQLRTPLATLQVQAERALRERDPAAGAEAVRHVLVAVQRLNHLAHQLLTLARAEPSAASQTLDPCDLAALARETTADWVPAAIERNVDLGYLGQDRGVMVRGNAMLLRELINNLIDNALKYGRSGSRGGHVTVGIDCDGEGSEGGGDAVVLSVEDNGPGIPAEARGQVMERFVRLPGNAAAGCGLGLSIVREIAARHDAQLAIESGDGGIGTRFVVRFAAAPRQDSAAAPDTLESRSSVSNSDAGTALANR
jgi:two-component system sensor histidine kinase TctE